METSNISLALFTLLAQSSAGLVLIARWADRSGMVKVNHERYGLLIPVVSLILIMVGLACSFLHIGYPANAINAINNLSASWMSREILVTMIYITVLLLWVITSLRWPAGRVGKYAWSTSILLAIILVFVMIKVYSLPAMKYLHQPSTAVAFINTTLLTGTIFTGILIRWITGKASPGLFILALIFTVTAMVNFILIKAAIPGMKETALACLIIYGSAILSLLLLMGNLSKNKSDLYSVIFIILVFAAEIANRMVLLNNTIAGI